MAINVASANNFRPIHLDHLSLQPSASFIRYTAPFILSVWILLVGCHWIFPSLLLSTTPLGAEPSSDFLRAFCLNIGQVMFQGNSISGLLFLLPLQLIPAQCFLYCFRFHPSYSCGCAKRYGSCHTKCRIDRL